MSFFLPLVHKAHVYIGLLFPLLSDDYVNDVKDVQKWVLFWWIRVKGRWKQMHASFFNIFIYSKNVKPCLPFLESQIVWGDFNHIKYLKSKLSAVTKTDCWLSIQTCCASEILSPSFFIQQQSSMGNRAFSSRNIFC